MTERRLVRIREDGQVTLPPETQRRYGLKKGDLVTLEDTGQGVVIKPVGTAEPGVGSPWLAELYELFGPVRQEATRSSAAEIDDAIDAAVKAVRRARA